MKVNNKKLIWIDLEMTGLNPNINHILEIATLITDSNLKILAEGPVIPIYQSKSKLNLMDHWNTYTHNMTGLIKKVKLSKFNEELAEKKTLDFLKKWVPEKKSPICGNSIGKDRQFLFNYMPTLESYFHYRYLDVSSIKELAKVWKPEILLGIKKNNQHKALSDIYNSIKELMYYRSYFIKI